MINKELDSSDAPDPLFIPLTSMTDEVFYLQPGTMEVLRERPVVSPSRSGVLCEELGKFLIMFVNHLTNNKILPRNGENCHDFGTGPGNCQSDIQARGIHRGRAPCNDTIVLSLFPVF